MNITELHKLKTNVERAASWQRDWEIQRNKLLALPAKLGFSSLKDLELALSLVAKDSKTDAVNRNVGPKSRKKRVEITDSIRHKVKALVEAKHTVRDIAKRLDISTASVQNIKTKLGLTSNRN